MGAPKNFYNAVDQAKLGIDQIPGMVKDIADIKEDISEITPLPDVTAADNGDILTVIDGAWGKGTPTQGLPDVTSADNGDLLEVVSGAWAKSGDVKTRIDYLYDYLNLSGEELIHSYDFTVNANDTITDNPINLDPNSGASFTSGGAAITANDLMQIRGIGSVCGFNRRLMFEFGAMNITAAGNLMSVYNGSYIKWDGTSWKINGTDTGIRNPNYFYNKTLQIKIGASYNDVTMTTQDGVLYKGAFDPTGQFNGIMYGGYTPNGGCCYSMYLKSLKVYASY